MKKLWEINTLIIAYGNANQYNPLGKYLTSIFFYLLTGDFTLSLPVRYTLKNTCERDSSLQHSL